VIVIVTATFAVFEAAIWVKINVYDKIMNENPKKRLTIKIKEILNKSPLKISFTK